MKKPKVTVLMSTYNGKEFLNEQIESILHQTEVEVFLMIRDDNSTDNTRDIIDSIIEKNKSNVSKYTGTNLGSANSFMHLVVHAKESEYYSFADQDDIWDQDKLKIAIDALRSYDDIPALYFCNTRLIDSNGIIIKEKMEEKLYAYSIQELLISNNCTGCTMVFNKKLYELLKKYFPKRMIMHDHWIYLLCTAVGGKVICDDNAHMSYRQHENNVLGAQIPIKKRILMSSFGKNRNIRQINAKHLLDEYKNEITKDAYLIIKNAAFYKEKGKIKLILMLLPFIKNKNRKIVLLISIILGFY